MEVILLERIARLGSVGDVVKVRDGYGRNFLLPTQKALRATKDNKAYFEAQREEIERKNSEAIAAAQEEAKKYENIKLTLVRQASQEGKLYGSVAVRDVAEALKAQGFEVENSMIIIANPIKNTGEYPIRVNLHAEVPVTVTLVVTRVEAGTEEAA